MFPANQDAPFCPVGGEPARTGEMAHSQKRQPTHTGNGGLGHLAVQGAHRSRDGGFVTTLCAKAQARQVGLAQNGNRQYVSADCPMPIPQRDQMPVKIDPCSAAPQGAKDMDAQRVQHCLGRFQTLCRIVVARGQDDLQMWARANHARDAPIKKALRFARRIDPVKDISCHKQRIHLFRQDHTMQTIQKRPVFMVTRPAIQGLANVPIGGVKDAHRILGQFWFLELLQGSNRLSH